MLRTIRSICFGLCSSDAPAFLRTRHQQVRQAVHWKPSQVVPQAISACRVKADDKHVSLHLSLCQLEDQVAVVDAAANGTAQETGHDHVSVAIRKQKGILLVTDTASIDWDQPR